MTKAVSISLTATECPFIDSVYVSESSDSITPFTEDISEQMLQTHGLTAKDLRKAQLEDLSLNFVIKCLEAGLPAPSRCSLDQVAHAKYIKEWNKMLLSNRVLLVVNPITVGNFAFLNLNAMSWCASVYMCFVVTCWERADLLALVCGV